MTAGAQADPPKLAFDGRRNALSLGAATVLTIVTLAVYRAFTPIRFTVNTVVLTAFCFWIAYSLTFLLLTQVAFGRADEASLRDWLQRTSPRRARPTLNVQWSLLAIAAVALVLLLPGLLDSPLANGLSFAVVVSAWLVTISSYAVHYARLNSAEPSIELPGTAEGPIFTDYYYLSAQIATTFSSSDISILTSRARAAVTGQTFIAFVFSTFIIAMLISVLFLSN